MISERNNPNHWRNNPAIVLSVLALLVVTVVPILIFGGGSPPLHSVLAFSGFPGTELQGA